MAGAAGGHHKETADPLGATGMHGDSVACVQLHRSTLPHPVAVRAVLVAGGTCACHTCCGRFALQVGGSGRQWVGQGGARPGELLRRCHPGLPCSLTMLAQSNTVAAPSMHRSFTMGLVGPIASPPCPCYDVDGSWRRAAGRQLPGAADLSWQPVCTNLSIWCAKFLCRTSLMVPSFLQIEARVGWQR